MHTYSCNVFQFGHFSWTNTPPSTYMSKVNNRNSKTRCKTCSKSIMKILERGHWRRSGVFTVNFEHISHVFPSVSIDYFAQVNTSSDSHYFCIFEVIVPANLNEKGKLAKS